MTIPIMSILRIFRDRLSNDLFFFFFITNEKCHPRRQGAETKKEKRLFGVGVGALVRAFFILRPKVNRH